MLRLLAHGNHTTPATIMYGATAGRAPKTMPTGTKPFVVIANSDHAAS
jgi:hypothetical protein